MRAQCRNLCRDPLPDINSKSEMGERETLTVSCHSYVHCGFRRCDIPHSQVQKFATNGPMFSSLAAANRVPAAPVSKLGPTVSGYAFGREASHTAIIQF